jgi:hypothetical protein
MSLQIGSTFGGVNLTGQITALAADPTGAHVYAVYGKEDASGTDRLYLAEFHPDSSANLVERADPVALSVPAQRSALPSVAVTANGTVAIQYDTFSANDGHKAPSQRYTLGRASNGVEAGSFHVPVVSTGASDLYAAFEALPPTVQETGDGKGFSRKLGAKESSPPSGADRRFPQAALTTRDRDKRNPARPYICRLITLSRFT